MWDSSSRSHVSYFYEQSTKTYWDIANYSSTILIEKTKRTAIAEQMIKLCFYFLIASSDQNVKKLSV